MTDKTTNASKTPRHRHGYSTDFDARSYLVYVDSIPWRINSRYKSIDIKQLGYHIGLIGPDGTKLASKNGAVQLEEGQHYTTYQKEKTHHGQAPAHALSYRTPAEVVNLCIQIAIDKVKKTQLKSITFGLVAGCFITFGALLMCSSAGGFDLTIRSQNPVYSKFIGGITFPIALIMIITVGGNLFTGNTMYMIIARMNGSVTTKDLLINWFVAWTSNFIGCVLSVYIFGYLTDLYSPEPFRSYVTSLAEKKVHPSWGVTFIKGVAANMFVCLAIVLGLMFNGLAKIVGIAIPIWSFVTIGFEHSIANMSFIPLGMMYGADVSVFDLFCYNIFPVTLGNILGGGIFVGCTLVFMYNWKQEICCGTASSHFNTHIPSLTAISTLSRGNSIDISPLTPVQKSLSPLHSDELSASLITLPSTDLELTIPTNTSSELHIHDDNENQTISIHTDMETHDLQIQH